MSEDRDRRRLEASRYVQLNHGRLRSVIQIRCPKPAGHFLAAVYKTPGGLFLWPKPYKVNPRTTDLIRTGLSEAGMSDDEFAAVSPGNRVGDFISEALDDSTFQGGCHCGIFGLPPVRDIFRFAGRDMYVPASAKLRIGAALDAFTSE